MSNEPKDVTRSASVQTTGTKPCFGCGLPTKMVRIVRGNTIPCCSNEDCFDVVSRERLRPSKATRVEPSDARYRERCQQIMEGLVEGASVEETKDALYAYALENLRPW